MEIYCDRKENSEMDNESTLNTIFIVYYACIHFQHFNMRTDIHYFI